MMLGVERQRPNLLNLLDFSLLDWTAGSGTDQITCKWLTLWNPDIQYFVKCKRKWKMSLSSYTAWKSCYCYYFTGVGWNVWCDVMRCLLIKWVSESWGLGGLKGHWAWPGEVQEKSWGPRSGWEVILGFGRGRQWRGLECNSWGKSS